MRLLDETDAQEREFAAALQGVNLSKSSTTSRAPASSNWTGGGFDAFYRENFDSLFSKVVI